jgi:hypothetical protein
MRTWGWALPALALVGIVVGCLRTEWGADALEAGHRAPPLEGADAEGRPMRLEDYRGRVVLLHFWHAS